MSKSTTPAINVNLIVETVSEAIQDELPDVLARARTVTHEEIKREYDKCFYCDGLVKRSSKHCGDHFPIPKRNNGTLIVPCCNSCHLMKDTFNFESWPVEWMSRIIEDFPKLNRETRIFLAKSMALMSDYMEKTKAKG